MKIISAKYIFANNEFLENSAILFNNKILEIDSLENLTKKYPNITPKIYNNNYVIYPGFINMHTHLEFSANQSMLKLGDFMEWLYSVFEYRDKLVNNLNQNILENAINQMLYSGVTTFGAISSFGADMQICKNTPLRVIYFNEVIGSVASMVDALFKDFKIRLEESAKLKSHNFYPAIAIHSPYSVHPILLKEVLKIAKEKNLLVSAHFLESSYEREWLENSSGEFKKLFEKFFNTSKPVNSIKEFLNAFKDIKTLFTHATQATKDEINIINNNNSSIIHCPISNRLLNCGKLDINSVNNLLLGTDGLSSNYSLSILNELKSALFMHTNIPTKELAFNLIKSVTTNASKATNLKIGKIKKDYFADFTILKLPNDFNNNKDSIALNSIIFNNKASYVYINGEQII